MTMLRTLARASWLALGVMLIAVGAVGFLRHRSTSSTLPMVYAELPNFELVDQDDQPFSLDRMSGRVWIANFIFTSCATVCPALTARMHDIQTRVADEDDIRLVSFSVDPVHDTPEKLRAYAHRFEADPARWTFVTGPLETVEKTVQDGFKMTMQQPKVDDDPGFFDIVHGERFVLVDREGRIRGYFDANDESTEQLLRAARQLVDAPDRAGEVPAVVSQTR
jgi:protein SCO1/2